jgi:hypothetical protein
MSKITILDKCPVCAGELYWIGHAYQECPGYDYSGQLYTPEEIAEEITTLRQALSELVEATAQINWAAEQENRDRMRLAFAKAREVLG